MNNYFTKAELYNKINQLRCSAGFEEYDYPLNLPLYCERTGKIVIGKIEFKTKGLRGMSSISMDENDKHVILLNKNESEEGQNFICGHEFIHILFHKKANVKLFSCFETLQPNQNGFLEWQANEGSAELILPMYKILPDIKKEFPVLKSSSDFRSFRSYLAEKYNVTEGVVNFRFESLKYEIQQYLDGTSLNDIEILSNRQRLQKGIKVKSLNDLENELLYSEYHIYIHNTKCIDVYK